MHITHKLSRNSDSSTCYHLNGIRVWYGEFDNRVHVGPLAYFSMEITDNTIHTLAKALRAKSGQVKIDPTNPLIMEFLKLTKCLP